MNNNAQLTNVVLSDKANTGENHEKTISPPARRYGHHPAQGIKDDAGRTGQAHRNEPLHAEQAGNAGIYAFYSAASGTCRGSMF